MPNATAAGKPWRTPPPKARSPAPPNGSQAWLIPPATSSSSALIYCEIPRPRRDPDRTEDISTRPPLTRVLKGKNQHAGALYLTNIFIEQMLAAHDGSRTPPPEPKRRHSVYNMDNAPSWASLIGLPSVDRRNQRKTYNRVLDALHKWELVDLGATGQRYADFRLNREDGSGRPYTIPRGEPVAPQHLCLPTEFFTAGWPLVLTPSELATFLAVCHVSDRKTHRVAEDDSPGSIFLAESLRYRHLGLSEEAYLAIHQLAEFGLIGIEDPMPNRRRGRISPQMTNGQRPQPYYLTATVLDGMPSHERLFNLDAFKRPAIEVAIDRLNLPMARYAIWAGTARSRS